MLIQLCSCVIYSKLDALVVLIKHLKPCKSYFKSQNKIGFNRFIFVFCINFTDLLLFPDHKRSFKRFILLLKQESGSELFEP